MKLIESSSLLFFILTSYTYADVESPAFSDYPVSISTGSFAKKLTLTEPQKKLSTKWKRLMRNELVKKVNYAGHYRVYLSKDGSLPGECGNDGWVCGWIIDKITGNVVSELPFFNGNTKYFSIVENGTPSPDPFGIEFYAKSNLMWIRGMNNPGVRGDEKNKCANVFYIYVDGKFTKLVSGKCEIDVGSDTDASHYLP